MKGTMNKIQDPKIPPIAPQLQTPTQTKAKLKPRLKTPREKLFQLYVKMLDPQMNEAFEQLLSKVFPNESELNILQSTVKQVGASELLANDQSFLHKFYQFIESSNYMRVMNMPENLKEAVQLLLCERTYLIQLLKGLIDKVLPRDRPRFFDDPFLEMQYQRLQQNSKLKVESSEQPTQNTEQHAKKPSTQGNTPLPIQNHTNPIRQGQSPGQIERSPPSLLQPQNAPHSTVIEDIVSGASSFFRTFISPGRGQQIEPQPAVNENQSDTGNRINQNRQYIQTNQKYTKAMGSNKLNNLNQGKLTQEIILKIDTFSDDDESVDISGSSSGSSGRGLRQSRKRIQTHHNLPNRGVVNNVQTKTQPAHPSAQGRGGSDKNNNRRNLEPSVNESRVQQNNRHLNTISVPNTGLSVGGMSRGMASIQNSSQNSSMQRKMQSNRYNKQLNESEDEEEDLGKVFYAKQEELKKNKAKTNQVDFLNFTQHENSKYVFDDTSKSKESRFSVHKINESVNGDSYSNPAPALDHQKSIKMKDQSHFKQSEIKMLKSNNFSRLHHDFSLESSLNQAPTNQDFILIQQEKQDLAEERLKRKSVGQRFLMSRESSFGMVGFKSQDQSQASKFYSRSQLGMSNDTNLNAQDHQYRQFGLMPDDDDDEVSRDTVQQNALKKQQTIKKQKSSASSASKHQPEEVKFESAQQDRKSKTSKFSAKQQIILESEGSNEDSDKDYYFTKKQPVQKRPSKIQDSTNVNLRSKAGQKGHNQSLSSVTSQNNKFMGSMINIFN